MNNIVLFESLRLIITFVLLFLFARWFVGFGVGAPYLPVRKRDIEAGLKLAGITSQDVVIDLGSGDGCMLLAALEQGAKQAIGYELNPFMVWLTRYRLKRFGDRAKIYRKNLFQADLSQVDVIFIFQINGWMERLATKLKQEAQPDARIIVFAHELPGFEVVGQAGIARLYKRPV